MVLTVGGVGGTICYFAIYWFTGVDDRSRR
jgi:hypothetical protein